MGLLTILLDLFPSFHIYATIQLGNGSHTQHTHSQHMFDSRE